MMAEFYTASQHSNLSDTPLCYDVLEIIFNHFDTPVWESKLVCAHIALACRTFASAIQPILWRRLPNLFPLLYLLLPPNAAEVLPKIASIDEWSWDERNQYSTLVRPPTSYECHDCVSLSTRIWYRSSPPNAI